MHTNGEVYYTNGLYIFDVVVDNLPVLVDCDTGRILAQHEKIHIVFGMALRGEFHVQSQRTLFYFVPGHVVVCSSWSGEVDGVNKRSVDEFVVVHI